MMNPHTHFFSPFVVSEATCHLWLELIPPQNDTAVKRLLEELSQRPDRVRIVLVDSAGPAVGVVVQLNPPGAIVWPPRVRTGLGQTTRCEIALRNAAAYVIEMCREAGLSYVECTVKGDANKELSWRVAMLREGFSLVSQKCQYKCTDLTSLHEWPKRRESFTIAEVNLNEPRIGHVFAQTLKGSFDRSTVFEGRCDWDGETDRVFIASAAGLDVGICVLEHETSSTHGWIKYVGTLPYFRRSGFAKELVADGLRRLAADGVEVVECLIDVENTPSIALHHRFGFRVTGTRGDSYYRSLSSS